MSWNTHKTLTYFIPNITTINKLAVLDLDGTLIVRMNGSDPKRIDNDPNNWIFFGPIPQKIQELKDDGWTTCIVTNQSRCTKEVYQKIENVRLSLESINGWSPIILIATGNDEYRKPNIGSLLFLSNLLNISGFPGTVCGDACRNGIEPGVPGVFQTEPGVPGMFQTETYPPYLWGSADIDFATNCGFSFMRPLDWIGSNRDYVASTVNEDMIIFVGNPGSGKSTLASMIQSRDQSYVICNQDTVGTKAKMLKLVNTCIQQRRKVIIDMMNASIERRMGWINIARQNNMSYRIIWILRDGRPFNEIRERKVSHFAYTTYYTNIFERPTENEGLLNIIYN